MNAIRHNASPVLGRLGVIGVLLIDIGVWDAWHIGIQLPALVGERP